MLSPESATWDKNLFAYCDNNPANRKDDGGQFWNVVIGAVVGAVVNAVTTAVETYKTTGSVDWVKVGISAAVGAVSGGIAATGLGVFAQAGISALASAAGSIATDVYNNTRLSSGENPARKTGGQILLSAAGSAAISFSGSIFGTALGKIPTNGLKSIGDDLVFRGKIGAGCITKRQAQNMVRTGQRMVNTAYGISSVVGTIFTWPTSTVLTYGFL